MLIQLYYSVYNNNIIIVFIHFYLIFLCYIILFTILCCYSVLHIFSYRLQKAIMNQCKKKSFFGQHKPNLTDFYRAVDIHNRVLMLVI